MPSCLTLSIIRYGSRVSDAIWGKEKRPSLHLSVAATEKGDFESPSSTVGQLTYLSSPYATARIWHKANFFKQSNAGLNSVMSFS